MVLHCKSFKSLHRLPKKRVVDSARLNKRGTRKHTLKEIDVINVTHGKCVSMLSRNIEKFQYDENGKLSQFAFSSHFHPSVLHINAKKQAFPVLGAMPTVSLNSNQTKFSSPERS